jgi:hypothetical protein
MRLSDEATYVKTLYNSFRLSLDWIPLLEGSEEIISYLYERNLLPPPEEDDKEYAKCYVMSFFAGHPKDRKNQEYFIKLNKLQLLKFIKDTPIEEMERILAKI